MFDSINIQWYETSKLKSKNKKSWYNIPIRYIIQDTFFYLRKRNHFSEDLRFVTRVKQQIHSACTVHIGSVQGCIEQRPHRHWTSCKQSSFDATLQSGDVTPHCDNFQLTCVVKTQIQNTQLKCRYNLYKKKSLIGQHTLVCGNSLKSALFHFYTTFYHLQHSIRD